MSFNKIQQRESGLKRQLSARQMSMIAIGGAIGTGLFLGSKFAIQFAGPSVLISYAIGGLITLLLMGCLAEMTVAHSTSGSFGVYAEHYISPLAGFLVKYSYWSSLILGMGVEITAVAEYMHFWFPNSPGWFWITLFSSTLIAINSMSIKTFGSIEYIFSLIKVLMICIFIFLGIYLIWGTDNPNYGIHNYTAHNGFMPNGLSGMWVAVVVAIFSYLSIEMIAVAAGEAENPEKAVKQAFRATMLRLVIFYLGALAIILAIVPWHAIDKGNSPFVTVMQMLNIPYAASILNFVVIIAALSAMNSQLYASTRMMFSLSRGGDAPSSLGKVNKHGVPFNALLLSTSGISLATILYIIYPKQAFTLMMSIAIFGAMFTWMMIFLTHYNFRRYHDKQGNIPLSFKIKFFPVSTLFGFFAMLSILITTTFTETFRMTLVFGLPFMLLLIMLFYFSKKYKYSSSNEDVISEQSPVQVSLVNNIAD